MSSGPTRMCEILVKLGDVNVLDVDDADNDVVVSVETRATVAGCLTCGLVARSKKWLDA